MDPLSLYQLYQGNDSDIDKTFGDLFDNTFETLYGHNGMKEIGFNYIDKLNETIDETYKIEDLAYFIVTMLPDFNLNWYHLEWCRLVRDCLKLCLLCSRDGGKSFMFSNAYPIWKMYRFKPLIVGEDNPRRDLSLSKRGYIMTNELDLGIELLAILKDTIESNDRLKEKLFPVGKSDSWSKTSITARNSCKLTVKSYGGSFRGRHPGYVVLDDYLRENVLYSQIQRDKSNQYFDATVMNAVLKNGQVIIVGTPMHEQDIYGRLKKRKNWTCVEYPAIFPDGTILDPDRYSYEDLMTIKEDQGSLIFSRERLVKPIMNDTSIFHSSFMKKAKRGMENFVLVKNRESFPKEFIYVVVGCDLAISASASADFCFYTVWGIDEMFDMWLMFVWRKKGAGYNEQLNVLKKIDENFSPDVFCIEQNQFQAVIGNGASELGLNVFLHHTGDNKYNFKYGLPAVATMFEKGKIHLPYGDEVSQYVTDLIIGEFTSIIWTPKGLEGAGAHDDGAMSTWKGYAGLAEIDKTFLS
jgi:phage terminase large subunit-like protein